MKAYKGGKTSGGKEPPELNLLKIIKDLGRQDVRIVKNTSEHKYSEMLLSLIKPYQSDRPGLDETDDLLYMAMNAWNLANLKKEFPEAYASLYEEIRKDFVGNEELDKLLLRMLTAKEEQFGSFPLYIIEYELAPGEGDNANLITEAGPLEVFLTAVMWDEEEDEEEIINYESGFINRSIVIMTPREPFLNWVNSKETGSLPLVEKIDPNVYLVAHKSDQKEMEKWLKKNFDRLFTKELDDWYTNKKMWPEKRTYKMFLEWFEVSFHLEAYDLEDFPVDKEFI